MQSWSQPLVSKLPGIGRDLALFDSATQNVRPTAPGEVAKIYVCGITPYDATHIGHANTYVAFDLLIRTWLDSGVQVEYVQNVTDIDEPLLERAVATGKDWREIADRETALFREDMQALSVIAPAHYIGAVESIPQIAEHVLGLQAAGKTYALEGDIYFTIAKSPLFGSISHFSRDEMLSAFAEHGGDPTRPGKLNALDPLLWKTQRPNEPAWDTVLGCGRPGWHIECSTIALSYLGNQIDVQGGGSDLKFPHHEMSSAQAESITGREPFARFYVHSGMVSWQGHKMSKSRGNLVFVSTLRHEGVDPMSIRLALLAHHYRSDWSWTPQGLEGAQARLELWRAATSLPSARAAESVLDRVREVMSDDLHTPGALDTIDNWARDSLHSGGPDSSGPELIKNLCASLLGVYL
ncbi:MAG: cysteine--1-D-myo-inosityl 2-amino-2-deoxy-alpha-D-glucopyranoside ligase [Candidatus Nanopelagicales bacterium]|nr:cysteine--1-D-myo-inosityl 2-amino-2-deoxy-alpha-D-glucopyranoside ligase [Candidatus Nanopelagicales bacterium]